MIIGQTCEPHLYLCNGDSCTHSIPHILTRTTQVETARCWLALTWFSHLAAQIASLHPTYNFALQLFLELNWHLQGFEAKTGWVVVSSLPLEPASFSLPLQFSLECSHFNPSLPVALEPRVCYYTCAWDVPVILTVFGNDGENPNPKLALLMPIS